MSGSKNTSEIKSCEVLVKVKFLQRGDKLFQYFIFDEQKNARFIRDQRYCVYRKFENKIKENLINNNSGAFEFVERVDSEDRITFVFDIKQQTETYNSFYFTIVGFVSKAPGCLTCIYNEHRKEVFIECPIRKKIIPAAMKSCALFRETEDLFKT